jgi:hypothetical protein
VQSNAAQLSRVAIFSMAVERRVARAFGEHGSQADGHMTNDRPEVGS